MRTYIAKELAKRQPLSCTNICSIYASEDINMCLAYILLLPNKKTQLYRYKEWEECRELLVFNLDGYAKKTSGGYSCVIFDISANGTKKSLVEKRIRIGLGTLNKLETKYGWEITECLYLEKNLLVFVGSKRWTKYSSYLSLWALLLRTFLSRMVKTLPPAHYAFDSQYSGRDDLNYIKRRFLNNANIIAIMLKNYDKLIRGLKNSYDMNSTGIAEDLLVAYILYKADRYIPKNKRNLVIGDSYYIAWDEYLDELLYFGSLNLRKMRSDIEDITYDSQIRVSESFNHNKFTNNLLDILRKEGALKPYSS